MATAQELFLEIVINPLRVSIGPRSYSYADYLTLPENQRGDDEAAVVDIQFTSKVLEWLGYGSGEIVYNRILLRKDRPDFRVELFGSTVFVVEDKNTSEVFGKASVEQLQRYTAGTSGYCLWTNGKTILGMVQNHVTLLNSQAARAE